MVKLEIYSVVGTRMVIHEADGLYDNEGQAVLAALHAMNDPMVGAICIMEAYPNVILFPGS